MVKIFIDAGHGGSDPGASANGLQEKNLTLDIAKRIRKYLNDNYTGHSIKLSRTNDKSLTLKQRTDMANRWGADYLLSVHINAGGGTGYEDFIFNGTVSGKTSGYRHTIHAEIVREVSNWRNRGKKRANFHVLRESRMPAMLSENGFIDTKADADKLKSSAHLNKIVKGHAVGLAKAFKLKKKSVTKPKPTKNPTKKPTGKTKLVVDGKWGKDTTRALQAYLGTPVDGIISKQSKNSVSQSLYGNTVHFGGGGSVVIRSLQKLIGAKADGLLGPDTVRALQKYLLTTVDGKLSRPSLVVKALQRSLNASVL